MRSGSGVPVLCASPMYVCKSLGSGNRRAESILSPSCAMTPARIARASSLSRMPKSLPSPRCSPWRRSNRLPMWWNVPAQQRAMSIASRPSTRATISRAARLVNVHKRMRSGAQPEATSCATRYTSVRVLPVPAPAMTSKGPGSASTTARCSGLRSFAASKPGCRGRSVLMTYFTSFRYWSRPRCASK